MNPDPAKHYVCEEISANGAPWRHPVQTKSEARVAALAAVAFGRRAPRPYRPVLVRVVDILTAKAVLVRRIA